MMLVVPWIDYRPRGITVLQQLGVAASWQGPLWRRVRVTPGERLWRCCAPPEARYVSVLCECFAMPRRWHSCWCIGCVNYI